MKSALIPLAVLLALPPASAQQAAGLRLEAILVADDSEVRRVWLAEADESAIRYRETEVATTLRSVSRDAVRGVFFIDPPAFLNALEAYEARDYAGAAVQFAALRERYRPLAALPHDPGTRAACFQLEALRRAGDFEGLAAALEGFDPAAPDRPHERRQVAIHRLWLDARAGADPAALLAAAEALDEPGMADGQLAQLEMIRGLALEAAGRKDEALDSYHSALVADAGATEDVAREAALAILRLHHADPALRAAFERHGSAAEDPDDPARARLLEAAAVARLFLDGLGAGAALPEEFRPYAELEAAAD